MNNLNEREKVAYYMGQLLYNHLGFNDHFDMRDAVDSKDYDKVEKIITDFAEALKQCYEEIDPETNELFWKRDNRDLEELYRDEQEVEMAWRYNQLLKYPVDWKKVADCIDDDEEMKGNYPADLYKK